MLHLKKNNNLKGSLTVSVLMLGLVSLVTTANAALTGIATTKHNLGSSNRDSLTGSTTLGGVKWTNATDEICVFCHTPHGSNSTAQVNAPLWNRLTPTTTSIYTTYSSGTMQGTAAVIPGSMSLSCLSCHDGTQAMDAMINKPGASGLKLPSAGVDPSTYRLSGNGAFMWYNGTAAQPAGDGALGDGLMFSTSEVTYGTVFTATMVGTDLSNDHPVGVPYCGGGQTALGSVAGCADTDFNPLMYQTGTGSTASFYVGNGYQKEQMRVYGSSPATATLECGSCHDPHVSNTFLRTSNSGGNVCQACHIK